MTHWDWYKSTPTNKLMTENSTTKAKILLVDDEANILRAISRLLKAYDITALTSAEEALLLAREIEFDVVISDFKMPGMNGVEFLIKFMKLQPSSIRMILTGYADLECAQTAINEAQVYRFINKPWNNIEITNAVQSGLEHQRILIENSQLADQVRTQKKLLDEKESLIKSLESEEPGITQVDWEEDGSIRINEDDYD